MVRYSHTGGAAPTQLSGAIDSDDLQFNVASGAGYPTGVNGPFWVVIDPGTANEEKILCSGRVDNLFTVTPGGRGGDDTSAVPHSAPAEVRHIFTAIEADDASAHIDATSGVHGVLSDVVGRTDVQELRGKTLSGAFNTFSNIPQGAITDLTARLNVPFWRGYKATPNAINPGVTGAPGTLTTLTSSGISTPSGAHSSAKRVPKDGLYLVHYKVRYGVLSGALEPGDFRLRIGLNPVGDGADTSQSGTVVAEDQNRHFWRPDRERIHVRTSLSINLEGTSYVNDLNLGATLPEVPHYVGVNLYSGTGSAAGWNIRTDNYTTSTFRLIMDRGGLAGVPAIAVPIRLFALYGGGGAVVGHSAELVTVLDLNEDDILVFRVWNNGTEAPVEIHGGQEYSQASIVWLGPS